MYLMASSPTQGYRFYLLSATTTVDAAWLARMVGFQYAFVSPFPMRRILTSGRLLGLKQGRVRFQWRDSKDYNQIKETSLDAAEFIRGFLLHLLPSGWVKIADNGESLSGVVTPGPLLPTSSNLTRRRARPVGSQIFTVIESHAGKRLQLWRWQPRHRLLFNS